jgi:hypothetical protein
VRPREPARPGHWRLRPRSRMHSPPQAVEATEAGAAQERLPRRHLYWPRADALPCLEPRVGPCLAWLLAV